MVFLIEFPDVNIFYVDVSVTTCPDFIARSDITDSLSYTIEWWYINDPETTYTQVGQHIIFENPLNDIDYHCLITENETVYDTTELLGYNFHLKILGSYINEYYKGEHETLIYSGYEDFNTYSGVQHKNNFKEDGISGYSGYSGIYLPVMNIIDSENIKLQKSYNDILMDENLNPIYDDERDSFSLFDKYGLDPTIYADQEKFMEIQKFEQENFTSYNKKSSMIRILKPIDEAMVRLYDRILKLEIINNFTAGENIKKHQLITLEEDDSIVKVFRANAFTTTIGGNVIEPRKCYGIALDNCNVGELCTFQVSGVIEEFNFWWNDGFLWDGIYDFSENLNQIYFLSLQGRMKYFFPHNNWISNAFIIYWDELVDREFEKSYSSPILYQEIGYPINDYDFRIDIKQPILRYDNIGWWDIPHLTG